MSPTASNLQLWKEIKVPKKPWQCSWLTVDTAPGSSRPGSSLRRCTLLAKQEAPCFLLKLIMRVEREKGLPLPLHGPETFELHCTQRAKQTWHLLRKASLTSHLTWPAPHKSRQVLTAGSPQSPSLPKEGSLAAGKASTWSRQPASVTCQRWDLGQGTWFFSASVSSFEKWN